MGSSESPEHKLLKEVMAVKLKQWFKSPFLSEFQSSGHELDDYGITYEGVKILVEIIWTPSKAQFSNDLNIIQADDADVKIVIVNPCIIQSNNFVRIYEKIRIAEAKKGFIWSEMIDGKSILDDLNYLDKYVKDTVYLLISKSKTIKDRFLNELNGFGLNGKVHLFTKDLQVGSADINCWKRGVFELADISQGYDGRRPICNKVIKSIHENIGTIINGGPYVGKSVLLKRIIYEMTNNGYSVFYVDDSSIDPSSLLEFIKRINNWNILQRILIIADDIHQMNNYNIFKTFNHFFRLGTSNIRFLLAGDMSKIKKTKALLEHDKNSEIDYALSTMHEIYMELKLNDAKIFINKLKQLGLIPRKVNANTVSQTYYTRSRGNPLIFMDHIRWLISGGKGDYKHPTLNYDFIMKNHIIEKNKQLMKAAIYSTFLSSFGIHPSVDILKRCGIYMSSINRIVE
jgi:hypothetical protein